MWKLTALLVLISVIFVQVGQGSVLCQCTSSFGSKGCINEIIQPYNDCKACNASACNMTNSCYNIEYTNWASSGSSCDSNYKQAFDIQKEKYKVVPDVLGDHCNQTACCCLVGEIIVTKQGDSITIEGATSGTGCPSSTVSTTFTSTLYGESFTYVSNFLGRATLFNGNHNYMTVNAVMNSQCFTSLEAPKKGGHGAVAGIVVGVILAVVIIVVIVVCIYRRRHRHHYTPV